MCVYIYIYIYMYRNKYNDFIHHVAANKTTAVQPTMFS